MRPMWVKKFIAPNSRNATPDRPQAHPMTARTTRRPERTANGKRIAPTPTSAMSPDMKIASTSG
ncbi:Uncharacterised protein [Mycobacteroides abscessus]|nr:Uncharacterised protein [Mycobacteroides abscessus]